MQPARARDDDASGETGPWAVSVFGGTATGGTFCESLTLKDSGMAGTGLFAVALSRRIYRFNSALSFEVEAGFGRRFGNDDLWEGWIAAGLRWSEFPWNNTVYTTFAVMTGPDLISGHSWQEQHDFDTNEHLLNYLAPEITFADPAHKDRQFFIRLHHRSGAFGLYDGADDAISFWTAGLRFRF